MFGWSWIDIRWRHAQPYYSGWCPFKLVNLLKLISWFWDKWEFSQARWLICIYLYKKKMPYMYLCSNYLQSKRCIILGCFFPKCWQYNRMIQDCRWLGYWFFITLGFCNQQFGTVAEKNFGWVISGSVASLFLWLLSGLSNRSVVII